MLFLQKEFQKCRLIRKNQKVLRGKAKIYQQEIRWKGLLLPGNILPSREFFLRNLLTSGWFQGILCTRHLITTRSAAPEYPNDKSAKVVPYGY